MPLNPPGKRFQARLKAARDMRLNAEKVISKEPSTYVDPVQANQTYFGSPAGPLTPATLDRPQLLAVQSTRIQPGIGRNIGSFGGSMATTIWKFTAKIHAGNRDKGTSVYCNSNVPLAAAFILAKAWATVLTNTLGNAGGDGLGPNPPADHGGTAGSPKVNFIGVFDALNPRVGQLFDVTPVADLNGVGTGAGNISTAGYLGVALSLRLTCQTTALPAPFNDKKTCISTHGFVGVPKIVIVKGDSVDLSQIVGTVPYDNYMGAYLQYICNPANNIGCMTIDPNASPKLDTGAWTYVGGNNGVGGVWTTTLAGNPFLNGDRVRITQANAPYFNGTYRVTNCVATGFAIVNGPPGTVAAPTHAKAQRVQYTTGVRPNIFAQYIAPVSGLVSPYGIKVSGRQAAKPYNPVSFRRRPKKVHG